MKLQTKWNQIDLQRVKYVKAKVNSNYSGGHSFISHSKCINSIWSAHGFGKVCSECLRSMHSRMLINIRSRFVYFEPAKDEQQRSRKYLSSCRQSSRFLPFLKWADCEETRADRIPMAKSFCIVCQRLKAFKMSKYLRKTNMLEQERERQMEHIQRPEGNVFGNWIEFYIKLLKMCAARCTTVDSPYIRW